MQVGLSIGSDGVYQAPINVSSKLALTGSELTKALLLSNSPGFTDILLEEAA
jgi:hypothetical protein